MDAAESLKKAAEGVRAASTALQQAAALTAQAQSEHAQKLRSLAINASRLAQDLGTAAAKSEVERIRTYEQPCGTGRRRFGRFPLHSTGIETAQAAYDDGKQTGLEWTDDYVPGGPHAFPLGSGRTTDPEFAAYALATQENLREWLRGWHDGKAERDRKGMGGSGDS